MGLSARHEQDLRKNNRAENSHQPVRRCEYKMQRFKSQDQPSASTTFSTSSVISHPAARFALSEATRSRRGEPQRRPKLKFFFAWPVLQDRCLQTKGKPLAPQKLHCFRQSSIHMPGRHPDLRGLLRRRRTWTLVLSESRSSSTSRICEHRTYCRTLSDRLCSMSQRGLVLADQVSALRDPGLVRLHAELAASLRPNQPSMTVNHYSQWASNASVYCTGGIMGSSGMVSALSASWIARLGRRRAEPRPLGNVGLRGRRVGSPSGGITR
jgi:hypothetical protein